MITFVGAGPGAEDLITVRGQRLLGKADIVIYAGSLVNPGLLSLCRENCEIYNSAKMTLEEVMDVMKKGQEAGKEIVRLHTGDPCLYGAIREQMDELEQGWRAGLLCRTRNRSGALQHIRRPWSFFSAPGCLRNFPRN